MKRQQHHQIFFLKIGLCWPLFGFPTVYSKQCFAKMMMAGFERLSRCHLSLDQCDQNLKYPIFPNVIQNVAKVVSPKSTTFQNSPPKVTKSLGYFCKKICSQNYWKMTQSGHTSLVQWESALCYFKGLNLWLCLL